MAPNPVKFDTSDGPTGPHCVCGTQGPMGPPKSPKDKFLNEKKSAYAKARRDELWYNQRKKQRRLVW